MENSADKVSPKVEQQMDDQVARVTEITVSDRTDIRSLKQVFEQYQQHNRSTAAGTDASGDTDQAGPSQEDLVVYGADRRESVLRETILDIVLSLEENPGRDLSSDPILLPEVAELVRAMTGIDPHRAAQLPFLFNEDLNIYEPDLDTLFAEAVAGQKGMATFDDIAFALAYAKVRAVVAGATPDVASPGRIPDDFDSID